jgi:hypothetical protein
MSIRDKMKERFGKSLPESINGQMVKETTYHLEVLDFIEIPKEPQPDFVIVVRELADKKHTPQFDEDKKWSLSVNVGIGKAFRESYFPAKEDKFSITWIGEKKRQKVYTVTYISHNMTISEAFDSMFKEEETGSLPMSDIETRLTTMEFDEDSIKEFIKNAIVKGHLKEVSDGEFKWTKA